MNIAVKQTGKLAAIRINDHTISNITDYKITIDGERQTLSMVIDLSRTDFSFELLGNTSGNDLSGDIR